MDYLDELSTKESVGDLNVIYKNRSVNHDGIGID